MHSTSINLLHKFQSQYLCHSLDYLNSPFHTLNTPAETTILLDNFATSSVKVLMASEVRFAAPSRDIIPGSLETRLQVIFPDEVSNTIKVKYEVFEVGFMDGLPILLEATDDVSCS